MRVDYMKDRVFEHFIFNLYLEECQGEDASKTTVRIRSKEIEEYLMKNSEFMEKANNTYFQLKNNESEKCRKVFKKKFKLSDVNIKMKI